MSNSYYEHKRLLLIAPIRSGGTLLSHALDSHPEIYCHRGEPVHRLNPIRQIADSPYTAIDTCMKMPGYEIAGCKITYEQFQQIGVQSISQLRVDRVIHLHRENALERIVSEQVRLIDKQQGLGTHTREDRDIVSIELNPELVLKKIEKYWEDVANINRYLSNVMGESVFNVTYEQITTSSNTIERQHAFDIQRFLGVSEWTSLKFNIVKRNPFPLSEIIVNYDELYNYFRNHGSNYLPYFKA